jgi:hypothetical protein
MRIRGSFVNFGTANETLWEGHVLRSAWQRRRAQHADVPRGHERQRHEQPVASPRGRDPQCAAC